MTGPKQFLPEHGVRTSARSALQDAQYETAVRTHSAHCCFWGHLDRDQVEAGGSVGLTDLRRKMSEEQWTSVVAASIDDRPSVWVGRCVYLKRTHGNSQHLPTNG